MALSTVELNIGSGGAKIVVDSIAGDDYEVIKLAFGAAGAVTLIDASNPLPVEDAAAFAALSSIASEDFATEVTLSAINGKTPSLGQALMAASVPVVIASNQSTIPVAIIAGGGGAVTIADGADVTQGALADAIVAAGAAGSISAKLRRVTQGLEDLKTLIVLAAGSAIIGKVGIDQTTPGTTNKVNIGTDGTVAIGTALPAGTNLMGKVGIDQTTPGTTNNVTTKALPDASSAYALTNVSSTAYEASHVLKSSPGYLYMVTGYNSKTSTQFIQLHNTTSVPADTAVPVLIFSVPPSSNFSLDLGRFGRYFSTGITIVNSSTGPTKTIGTTDCWFDAQVI